MTTIITPATASTVKVNVTEILNAVSAARPRYGRLVTDIRVHRAGDRFVIDAGGSTFGSLIGLVRGNHLAHQATQGDVSTELRALRSVIDRVAAQLPKGPSYPSHAMIQAQDIDGVDFGSVSTRVVIRVDRQVLEGIAEALERVIV
jgi:hypothetical protein